MKNKIILLLSVLLSVANAANIAYVAKVGPGSTVAVGAGKQWPTTRFVAGSGDSAGCITDNLTGLMWSKNASLLGTGTWGSSATSGTAQYKIAQMNNTSGAVGYHLCGYSDWRLPTVNELASLINYAVIPTGSTPAVWLTTQGFVNVQVSNPHWSSIYFTGNTQDKTAIFVFFNTSSSPVGNNSITTLNYVWAVRGGR